MQHRLEPTGKKKTQLTDHDKLQFSRIFWWVVACAGIIPLVVFTPHGPIFLLSAVLLGVSVAILPVVFLRTLYKNADYGSRYVLNNLRFIQPKKIILAFLIALVFFVSGAGTLFYCVKHGDSWREPGTNKETIKVIKSERSTTSETTVTSTDTIETGNNEESMIPSSTVDQETSHRETRETQQGVEDNVKPTFGVEDQTQRDNPSQNQPVEPNNHRPVAPPPPETETVTISPNEPTIPDDDTPSWNDDPGAGNNNDSYTPDEGNFLEEPDHTHNRIGGNEYD